MATKTTAELVLEDIFKKAADAAVKAAAVAKATGDATDIAIAESTKKHYDGLAAQKIANEQKLADDKAFYKATVDLAKDNEKERLFLAKEATKSREDAEKSALNAIKDARAKRDSEEKEQLKAGEEREKKKAAYTKAFGDGLTAVATAVGTASSAIISFGQSLAGFVGKANPAALQQFNLAVADLQAVMGQILTPLFRIVTGLVRQMGDALISLSPQAKRLIAGLVGGGGLVGALVAVTVAIVALLSSTGIGIIIPIIGAIIGAFAGLAVTMDGGAGIAKSFSGILEALGTALEAVAAIALPLVDDVLKGLAYALENATKKFKQFIDSIKKQLENLGIKFDPKKESSTGAAVRNASIESISSFANQAYTNAYKTPDSKEEIPSKTLVAVTKTKDLVSGILDLLTYGATKKEGSNVYSNPEKIHDSFDLVGAMYNRLTGG